MARLISRSRREVVRSRASAAAWAPILGRSPFGRWEVTLPDQPDIRALFSGEGIDDILLVVTYRAALPAWPG